MAIEKNKGHQKIEMTKIAKESNLLVTFSNRRSSLFNKASELCTLCGAEVAIVVFSPGKKAFSFGHPCVEDIIDRFINKNSNVPNYSQNSVSGAANKMLKAHRNSTIRDLNMELTQVNNKLKAEKKHGDILNKMKKIDQSQYLWEGQNKTFQLEQLGQLMTALLVLKKKVEKEANKRLVVDTLYNNNTNNNFFAGNSSNAGGGWYTTDNNGVLNFVYGGGVTREFM